LVDGPSTILLMIDAADARSFMKKLFETGLFSLV